ncbi:protein kinase domain-containing protein [Noviherbaspirillum sp.]|uniref:protein kinase domain-containing protein n=1 Tax=Noviherbaspirillum sp. TaxID=1926288 RepID=UPI002FE38D63
MNHDNHMSRTRSQAVAQQTVTRSEEHPGVALPVGTHLGEFEILGLIGEGGFGIVYLAYDHSLNRRVALKEYMPSGLVERNAKMAVTVKSQRNSHAFSVGLKSFVNEARMLAQFDSPALVKVHRFWEENGTAYMVMPYYDGVTLRQAVKEHRIKPNESWIRLLLSDLCDAIETIHRAQCFHRDIAPDNILLLKDGRPLLLDFGAARMVIGDLTQCLTVILKPGYAPIEQYAENGGLRQGPWTDIYALAGVVYYLITGMAPPPSVARIVHDELVPARIAGKDRYSGNFLAVIDKALAVKPEHRFQSIAELRHSLDLMETVPRSMPPTRSQRPQEDDATRRVDATVPTGNTMHAPPAGTRLRSGVYGAYGKTASASPFQWMATRMHAAGTWPKWIAAGGVLVAGLASGLYFGSRETVVAPLAVSDISTMQGSSGGSGVTEEETPKPAASVPSAARKASVQGQVRPAASMPPAAPDRPAAVPRGDEPQHAEPAASRTVPAPSRSSSEEKLWRRTVLADNAIDYDNYLREYPQGQYAAIARRKLESMQAAATPAPVTEQRARAADTKAAETKAVESKAADSKAAESKAAAGRPAESRNEENAASENAAAASTGAAQSPWAAESKMWDMATAINQEPAYESYLRKYPQGRFAALARDKLAGLKPSTPAAEPAPAESPAPAPSAKAREPAQPAAGNSEPRMPERQANLKPLSPSAPAARTDIRTEARTDADSESKPAAESPAAGRRTMKAGDQTLIGDFVSDPVTGVLSGTGRIIWTDGNRFEGTLVKGVKEGKGKFTWHNGQRYTGDWSKDAPNGKGTIEYANGIRYQGDVRDGMPHGQGTLWFRDGDVYKGSWVQGRSHGQGRYTWANGSYWEGEFRDDKRTENGKMVFADKADSSAQMRN